MAVAPSNAVGFPGWVTDESTGDSIVERPAAQLRAVAKVGQPAASRGRAEADTVVGDVEC